jgi:hypothetical protein
LSVWVLPGGSNRYEPVAARRDVRVLEIGPLAGERERVHLARVLVRRQQDARREANPHGEARAFDVGHQQLEPHARRVRPVVRERQIIGRRVESLRHRNHRSLP